MTPNPDDIANIEAAIQKVGAVAFAREAGLPYTTLRDWQRKRFQHPALAAFDKMASVAKVTLRAPVQDAA